ncbi:hypothetical protein EPO33_00325 [Patescibacteria group bacterium]|nr:MAG: hypothetical protein EPO33_00325 [Patescibacteria group bacterium]
MQKHIIAVFGDIGGCKETVPALALLKKRRVGIEIVLDASPQSKAATVLPPDLGPTSQGRMPVDGDAPDAIVVGVSATAVGAQIAWTDWGRSRGIPVIWIEDLYGTGERASVRGCAGPSVLCAIDEVAGGIAHQAWPDAQIVVCGKPTFAHVGQLIARQVDVRERVRTALGLRTAEKLLTWYSGGDRPAEELATVIEGIEPLQKHPELRVAARVHPKMAEPVLGQIRERIASWPASFRIDPAAATALGADELTIGSDVVVGTWGSTQCYVAVLAHVACISTHYGPPEPRLAVGYPRGDSPAVAAGAAIKATTPAGVRDRVIDVLAGTAHGAHAMRSLADPFRALIAPDAPERIADAVVAALG